VLRREVRDARPPHVEYVLTSEGRQLRALLDALAAWASA
jgi:DNA-binding HxlR family transcriptional regulator